MIPFFGDACHRVGDGLEAVVQLEPGGAQGWAAVVGQRAAHREAVAAGRPRCGVRAPFQGALDRADAAHLFLQLLLGVAVGLVNGLGRLAQIVEVAQLVRHVGQGRGDRLADGELAVGEDGRDRDGQGLPNLNEEGGEVLLGGAEQAAGEQHLARQAVAQHPQHLVADVRLQPVQRQDDAALLAQQRVQAVGVGEVERDQFLVALEQMRHGALSNHDPALVQGGMNLRDALVAAVAAQPDEGDHVQAELALGQGEAAFGLGSVRPAEARASRRAAAADLEGEPDDAVERRDRAPVVVGDPQRAVAAGAAIIAWDERRVRGRRRTAGRAGHHGPPGTGVYWRYRRPRPAALAQFAALENSSTT